MNAYEQITMMRYMLVESSAGHWQDTELIGRLNAAQRRLALYIGQQPGGWLIKRKTVTASGGEIDWPVDCAKPVYLEEVSSGAPIGFTTSVQDRLVGRVSAAGGYPIATEAYLLRKKIVVNKEDYSGQCYFWYQQRVPDLHVGTASAGGTDTITLSRGDGLENAQGFGAKPIEDYYVGVNLQIVDGTGEGTIAEITEYAANREATVEGTFDDDSDYAMISLLPEDCHELMYHEAALAALSKPAAALDPKYFEYLRSVVNTMKKEFETWIASHIVGTARTRTTELD